MDDDDTPPLPDWLRVRCHVLLLLRTAYAGHWWRHARGAPVWN